MAGIRARLRRVRPLVEHLFGPEYAERSDVGILWTGRSVYTYETRPGLIPEPYPNAVGHRMRAYGVAFAAGGEPAVASETTRPEYDAGGSVLELDDTAQVLLAPLAAETAAWDGVPFDGLDPAVSIGDAFRSPTTVDLRGDLDEPRGHVTTRAGPLCADGWSA